MPDKPNPMILQSSPHIYSGVTTRSVMIMVLIALAPVTVYGIVLYGLPGLFLILTCVLSAIAAEAGFRALLKQDIRIGDCSAVVTGLLIALILPPSTPLWMAVIGSVFAIIVAKEFFGGLGANPFNPALIGRAVLLMSFPAAITTWHKPFQAIADVATTATPLNIVKQAQAAGQGIQAALEQAGRSVGASDVGGLYWTMFLGNRSGSLGESSIILILAGGIFLMAIGVIQWTIPVAMLSATALVSWALGMDPLFAVLSGGVAFGAFFMATDFSTSPITLKGKLVYGAGAGAILVLIRKLGGYPEGVTYAILMMNAIAPFLDKFRARKYGWVRPPKAAKEGAK